MASNSLSLHPAPHEVSAFVADLIGRLGVNRTARELGLSRHIVMAIASGAPVYAGTRLMAMEAMRSRGML